MAAYHMGVTEFSRGRPWEYPAGLHLCWPTIWRGAFGQIPRMRQNVARSCSPFTVAHPRPACYTSRTPPYRAGVGGAYFCGPLRAALRSGGQGQLFSHGGHSHRHHMRLCDKGIRNRTHHQQPPRHVGMLDRAGNDKERIFSRHLSTIMVT